MRRPVWTSALAATALTAVAIAIPTIRAQAPAIGDAAFHLRAFATHQALAAVSPYKALAWQSIGPANNSGRITGGSMGAVTIGGSITGGGDFSGQIAAGTVGAVMVGGSLAGGAGAFSGRVIADTTAAVTIGGSVTGGVGAESGQILAVTTMGAVKISGSVTGGAGDSSGRIIASMDPWER